ncbi:hypothetical protein [Helicovermis profundi]|uniref:Helix-turn-helix domain-containing protein n=1 Tax=Helicovermis profundi TaxID=3065157 RepID=A0AAU9E4K0_9FIRM|nr:hypothetical protein HLPR_16790 [Clostridia bacterium S502]
MIGIISIIVGSVIIIVSYYLFQKELNKVKFDINKKYSFINNSNTKDVLINLEKVEDTINELNRSFYDIVSDLEGKYSIHEKQLDLFEEKLEKIELQNKIIDSDIKKIKSNLSKEIQGNKVKRISKENIEYENSEVKEVEELVNEKDYDLEKHILIPKNTKKRILLNDLNYEEKSIIRSKVIELRQTGYSLNQIAKKLDVGIGELQLILNLSKK